MTSDTSGPEFAVGHVHPVRTETQEQSLFRSEVIIARQRLQLGRVRISSSPMGTILSVVSGITLVGVILLVLFGSVTRKARVSGVVVPVSGAVGVSAQTGGVLLRTFVVEGQFVQANAPLFEISTAREGSGGEVSALIEQQLEIQRRALQNERKTKIAQSNERRKSLTSQIKFVDAQLAQIAEEIQLTQRQVAISSNTVEQYGTLEKQGFASSVQLKEKQALNIELSTRLSSLQRNKLQLSGNREALLSEIEELDRITEADLSTLDRTNASVVQQQVENSGKRAVFIRAPSAGRISSITYMPGQTVVNGQPLASMIPGQNEAANNDLEVQLYIPSKTIGFAAVGQEVLVRYDAFPFQKFGAYSGVITEISATPFAPGELPMNLADTVLSSQKDIGANGRAQALYRLKVRMKSQFIRVYGKQVKLRPGMTVEADIHQDNRRIWEWVLDPLFAVFGKHGYSRVSS